jgi:hypothetical protein
VIPTDRQWPAPRGDKLTEGLLNVGVAKIEIVPRSHRHIAKIRNPAPLHRLDFVHVVKWADTLDRAQRARTKPRTGAIGDAKIHWHTNETDLARGDAALPYGDWIGRRPQQCERLGAPRLRDSNWRRIHARPAKLRAQALKSVRTHALTPVDAHTLESVH